MEQGEKKRGMHCYLTAKKPCPFIDGTDYMIRLCTFRIILKPANKQKPCSI